MKELSKEESRFIAMTSERFAKWIQSEDVGIVLNKEYLGSRLYQDYRSACLYSEEDDISSFKFNVWLNYFGMFKYRQYPSKSHSVKGNVITFEKY